MLPDGGVLPDGVVLPDGGVLPLRGGDDVVPVDPVAAPVVPPLMSLLGVRAESPPARGGRVRVPRVELPAALLPDIPDPALPLPDIPLPDDELPDIPLPDEPLPDIPLPDIPLPEPLPDMPLPVAPPLMPPDALPPVPELVMVFVLLRSTVVWWRRVRRRVWLRFVMLELSRPFAPRVLLIVVLVVVELVGGCDGVVCADAASGTIAIVASVAMIVRIKPP